MHWLCIGYAMVMHWLCIGYALVMYCVLLVVHVGVFVAVSYQIKIRQKHRDTLSLHRRQQLHLEHTQIIKYAAIDAGFSLSIHFASFRLI